MEKAITKAKHLSVDKRKLFYQSKYDYYKKVNNVAYAPPQFLDSKQ